MKGTDHCQIKRRNEEVLCVITSGQLIKAWKFCLLFTSLNLLISLHVKIYAQSHALEKEQPVTVWLLLQVKFVSLFMILRVNDDRPVETLRVQTQSLRGLKTWRIKIMGEVPFKWLMVQSVRGSKAGQGRSLCGGPAAALLFNQRNENCHSCQSRCVYWEENKLEKERARDLLRGRVKQPVWSGIPSSKAATFVWPGINFYLYKFEGKNSKIEWFDISQNFCLLTKMQIAQL